MTFQKVGIEVGIETETAERRGRPEASKEAARVCQ
jgi:hypothetical protein